MKKILGVVVGMMFAGYASAADITLYYSPTCPHCHHAREFISNNLIYEYPELRVTTVNVMDAANSEEFVAALRQCKYESGGVPVLIVGEKCFQGYGDSMADSVREAVAADLDNTAKKLAAENKKAMEADADAFRKAHADRLSAIVEREVAKEESQKKTDNVGAKKSNDSWVFYVILAVFVFGLGFVLTRKGK